MSNYRGRGGGGYTPRGGGGYAPHQHHQHYSNYGSGAPQYPPMQTPPQGGYAPRSSQPQGGYSQQPSRYDMGGRYAAPQQGYNANYTPRPASYEGHYHHQQHHNSNFGYQGGGGAYQSYGGPRHHHHHHHQQQHGYQQSPYSYGRGRGGFRGGGGAYRGRGGGGGRGPVRDYYCLVHLDSFAQLEDVGRKGTLDGVAPGLLESIVRRSRGNPLHLLLVVEKKYLAACMSTPKSRDDVFLSPTTTQTFLNIETVLSDDGDRLVTAQSGSTVARHLFVEFNKFLTSLAAFDKPTPDAGEIDVLNAPAADVLTQLENNKAVFDKVEAVLLEETEASKDLFIKLCFAPAEAKTEEKKEVTAEETTAAPETTRTSVRKCLLTTAQGSKLFIECLDSQKKRGAFFHSLEEVLGVESDGPFFFKSFFNGLLFSEIILKSFGCSLVNTPTTLDREEVNVICKGFSRYGLLSLCTNGGSTILNALIQALRPEYKTIPIGRITHAGEKRQRDGDDAEKEEEGVTKCPASLEEYDFPKPPKDWSIFYACAKTFVGGELDSTEAVEEGKEGETALRKRRIEILSQHIVACRAVQLLIPHFADSVLDSQRKGGEVSSEHSAYQENCNTFLTELAERFFSLVTHIHGNYVAQTLIAELAPRGIPNTRIHTIFKGICDILVENAFELSVQKCSSNCVERALECTMASPEEGIQFLFRVAQRLLTRGQTDILHVARNCFGNYVIRHICQSLTSIVTGVVKSAVPEVVQTATTMERQFLNVVVAGEVSLQNVPFGAGILHWMKQNKARILSSPAN